MTAKPTGWIATHKDGRVVHFSTHDGWNIEVVTEEPRDWERINSVCDTGQLGGDGADGRPEKYRRAASAGVSRLLPCPFCDFQPDPDDADCIYPTTRDRRVWNLNCYETGGGCSAHILGSSPEECITKWNRRAAPAAEARRTGNLERLLRRHLNAMPRLDNDLAEDTRNALGDSTRNVGSWSCIHGLRDDGEACPQCFGRPAEVSLNDGDALKQALCSEASQHIGRPTRSPRWPTLNWLMLAAVARIRKLEAAPQTPPPDDVARALVDAALIRSMARKDAEVRELEYELRFLRWCIDRAEGYSTGFGITGVPGCNHATFAAAVEEARTIYREEK